MSSIDPEKMTAIAEALFVSSVAEAFGEEGTKCLRQMNASIREIYRYVEPDHIAQGLVIYMRVSSVGRVVRDVAADSGVVLTGPETLAPRLTGNDALELLPNGELKLEQTYHHDLEKLSHEAVVYVHTNSTEYYLIKGRQKDILNPAPLSGSIYANATYKSLRQALEDYAVKAVRASGCVLFSKVWADTNRVNFCQKPEMHMRRSLHHFLRAALRDAEVRPEQIVDESHPVDIKVTWTLSNRLALIEIKWLGRSVNDAAEVTTEYGPNRARSGAKQLAAYLDANYSMATAQITMGYLVVVDARRKGKHAGAAVISGEDGLAYQYKDIDFDPEYHKIRNDFDPPYRMFAEPICAQS